MRTFIEHCPALQFTATYIIEAADALGPQLKQRVGGTQGQQRWGGRGGACSSSAHAALEAARLSAGLLARPPGWPPRGLFYLSPGAVHRSSPGLSDRLDRSRVVARHASACHLSPACAARLRCSSVSQVLLRLDRL